MFHSLVWCLVCENFSPVHGMIVKNMYREHQTRQQERRAWHGVDPVSPSGLTQHCNRYLHVVPVVSSSLGYVAGLCR